jgi:hypothetical protein
VAEAAQFVLDAFVAPAGIVAGDLLDQGGDGRVDRRAAGPARDGPVPGDQPATPGKNRGRIDEPVHHQPAGEEPDQAASVARSAQSSRGLGFGPTQDRVLVAQDQDLDVLGRIAAGEQVSHSVVRRNAR